MAGRKGRRWGGGRCGAGMGEGNCGEVVGELWVLLWTVGARVLDGRVQTGYFWRRAAGNMADAAAPFQKLECAGSQQPAASSQQRCKSRHVHGKWHGAAAVVPHGLRCLAGTSGGVAGGSCAMAANRSDAEPACFLSSPHRYVFQMPAAENGAQEAALFWSTARLPAGAARSVRLMRGRCMCATIRTHMRRPARHHTRRPIRNHVQPAPATGPAKCTAGNWSRVTPVWAPELRNSIASRTSFREAPMSRNATATRRVRNRKRKRKRKRK